MACQINKNCTFESLRTNVLKHKSIMKKFIITVLAVIIASFAWAQKLQEKDVNAVIKGDFNTRFSETGAVKWSKDQNKIVAKFVKDEMNVEVMYENNAWQQTNWNFPTKYAPQSIKEYVGKNNAGFKLASIALVDKGMDRQYKVLITKKKLKQTLIFDLNGMFLRTDA